MLDNAYLKGIPLLVIGNKIDVKDHMSEAEIIESRLTRAVPRLHPRQRMGCCHGQRAERHEHRTGARLVDR